MQDQIELPEIEGVSIPSYVRFLANGKQMHLTNENIFDLEEKPKYSLKNIQSDLESLAKSDSILIQKYVNLYKQVTALKQELKQPPIPPTPVEITPTQKLKQNLILSRSNEEKKKYAAKRKDIPSSGSSVSSNPSKCLSNLKFRMSSRSQGDYNIIGTSDRMIQPDLTRDHNMNGMVSRDVPNPRLTITQTEIIRADSLNSVFSGSETTKSNSSELGISGQPEPINLTDNEQSTRQDTTAVDFDEISMPEEGELSNLDVNWFLNYKCTSDTFAKI